MSNKYDSVNERTHWISESVKLHILGVWQNAREINYATLADEDVISESFDNW